LGEAELESVHVGGADVCKGLVFGLRFWISSVADFLSVRNLPL
jgi:hypothetical protein